jgi:YbbR domain-containing protein
MRPNLKPLIGSILIAVIIWVLVATDKNYFYQIKVPIRVIRLAPGKILKEKIPEHAIIEVQGKGRALIASWFYDIKFSLELPDINRDKKIELAEYLNFLDLPATFGLEVVDIIEPKTLDLKVDDEWMVKKPVRFSGNVGTEDGYILLNYEIDRDSVELSGPKSLLQSVSEITTDTLELYGQKSNFSQKLNLMDPYPELIEMNPTSVSIEFDIQRLGERTIYDVPITVINVPSNIDVEAIPPKLSLRIKGGVDLIAEIQPADILAEIDFGKSYESEKDSYGARIITPEDVTWIESIPKTFKLKVRRQ